ncbi:endolysin [Agrobacterium phage Atu_ph03]|uniref:Peptidoglycan hydrolase n=2 Tax=Atuphduovirus TaxID=2731928 RepID=A0A2L0UYX0_9CAUD|nr:endolysin [Agrobacterium phage Atu_ph02]YP_009791844.1 endolysin [Agrobacterium phage Atu_ph03]AUZ94729.1 peptidoglycan hydrolase [Agrobacterium phage Atu_ph02]AUZ94766.1 peptidoglycan hydrolase [Agrobacterium phage Atu_ph03]
MALNKNQETYVRQAARAEGLNEAFCLAIVDKESAGKVLYAVNGNQYPAIRFEGHIFYQRLSGKERDEAVKQGLASPKTESKGGVKNPGTMSARYALLKRAAAINHAAAYASISTGIGQIMGFHFKTLGYGSAFNLWVASCRFEGQVDQMLRFIKADARLVKAVNSLAFKDFALIYNGKAAKSTYWTELEKFYKAWASKAGNVGSASLPSNGEWFDRIKALGFGSVMEFQQARTIKVDGIIGKITRENVEAAEQEAKERAKEPLVAAGKIAGAGVGVATAVLTGENPDVLTTALDAVTPVITFLKGLVPFGGTVVLAGAGAVVAYAGYKAYIHWKK